MSNVTANPTYDIEVGNEKDNDVNVDIDENGKAEVVESAETESGPALAEPKDESPAKEAKAEEGELKDYSEGVKKRIDKLTSKLREAERREQAAIEYAKGVQSQAQMAQQRAVNSDYGRLAEAKSRVDTQLMTIRQIIKRAREEGDIDTETEAQERLASLAHEQRQLQEYLNQAPDSVTAAPQQPYTPPQPQQVYQPQYQQPVQQQPKVDPKAEEWAENNPWFGQDYSMTYAAWGIDKQLREAEGFDGSSEEYYDELNRRIRAQFPQKFAAQPNRQQRSVQPVAPAARSSGVNTNARRSVRLSPSQVAIAKKLGVPIEEYAKYVKD
jgi:hypothetical protein